MRWKYGIYCVVMYLLAVFLQVNIADNIAVAAVAPDLFLVLLICLALFEGSNFASLFGLAGGLALDILTGLTPGFYGVQYALIGAVAGLLSHNRFVDRIIMPMILTGGMYLMMQCVTITVLYLQKVPVSMSIISLKAGAAALYTALICAGLYQGFAWLYVKGPLKPPTNAE